MGLSMEKATSGEPEFEEEHVPGGLVGRVGSVPEVCHVITTQESAHKYGDPCPTVSPSIIDSGVFERTIWDQ